MEPRRESAAPLQRAPEIGDLPDGLLVKILDHVPQTERCALCIIWGTAAAPRAYPVSSITAAARPSAAATCPATPLCRRY
jgi:hypothetical protein